MTPIEQLPEWPWPGPMTHDREEVIRDEEEGKGRPQVLTLTQIQGRPVDSYGRDELLALLASMLWTHGGDATFEDAPRRQRIEIVNERMDAA